MTEPAVIPARADLTANIIGLKGKLSEVEILLRYLEGRKELLEDAIAQMMKQLEALRQAEAAPKGEHEGPAHE
jgi:hypothetical protein